jgi:hypothetical protein
LASGEYGTLPTPWAVRSPNISRSSSRISRLYWSCMETNLVHIEEAPR